MTDLLVRHLEAIAALAPVWGFLLIFLFMAVESSFVPFPSEVVMIPAGFLAARGGLSLGRPLPDALLALACGVAGSLAGAYLNYFLSLRLGRAFLERYGRYFFLPPSKLHRAEEVFRRYGAGATFVCRLLPAIRQLISIPAGIARMPLASFSLWTGLGAGTWCAILTAIGFSIGRQTAQLSYAELVYRGQEAVSRNLHWIAPACLAGFALYVLVSRRVMASRGGLEVS
jgi:membrane protein DedA with SNARE-associated domain